MCCIFEILGQDTLLLCPEYAVLWCCQEDFVLTWRTAAGTSAVRFGRDAGGTSKRIAEVSASRTDIPIQMQAMFEGILLELPLAGFFLKKFRAGAWCDVNDLPTLDAELYRNLMRLRDYEGDASDLALTFTVADSTLGDHREVGRLWKTAAVWLVHIRPKEDVQVTAVPQGSYKSEIPCAPPCLIESRPSGKVKRGFEE